MTKLEMPFSHYRLSMFITDFEIRRREDLVGILSFSRDGFSLPNNAELLNRFRQWKIKDHEVIMRELGEMVMVSISPNDFTRNKLLHAVKVRLRYTGFVLVPQHDSLTSSHPL